MMEKKCLKTPYYVVDEALLRRNLETLKAVKDRSGCKILLAQKAFSMFSLYPLISEYLDGTTASGLYEAKLGHEHFTGETHVFSPAYQEDEFDEILSICEHVVFNSFSQWERFRERAAGSDRHFGIRVNPEHSTQDHKIYDPCYRFSRLGVTEENFRPDLLAGIDGLHMHTLCEQNSDALCETFEVFEQKFGKYLYNMNWLNLGGGHHITRPDYDVDALVDLVKYIINKYHVIVYLEPGEAVALNTGFLVSSVCDLIHNDMNIAILDTSAACHMPDVLEMPYRPEIIGADQPGIKAQTYRLGGVTCLAGDIIGDYSFDREIQAGDRLYFEDMAIYSMVKNNTFNGIGLPDIAVMDENGDCRVIRSFGYEDFKERLS